MTRAAVPVMLRAGWGRVINVSINFTTMRRRGFSPYAPSKAALESMTAIWAQELSGTGVTVNALLPGGATRTGMIPDELPGAVERKLLDPQIIVPPLLYLSSPQSEHVTGQRCTGTLWPDASPRDGCQKTKAKQAALRSDNEGWFAADGLDRSDPGTGTHAPRRAAADIPTISSEAQPVS